MERAFANDDSRLAYLQQQGYFVAQRTSQLNGNLIRVPASVWGVLGHGLVLEPELSAKPIYQLDSSTLARALDKTQLVLDLSLAALENDRNAAGQPLRWHLWDAFFRGIQKYNDNLNRLHGTELQPVYVDLSLADSPPAIIIEAPTDETLRHFTAQTSGSRLWNSYKRLQATFVAKLIQRYGRRYSYQGLQARIPIAIAIEMFNEPDYVWLPDEVKIERALNPDAYPCDKYVTQLHLSQIPTDDLTGKGCARPEGFYKAQDLALPTVETPLDSFRWGLKFDRYVTSFADLHEQASLAAKDEIRRGNAEMVVVSSAVTHVNLDWFVRMFRANRNTFLHVDKIAIHPYHWPQHDIHDMRFVGGLPEEDWRRVNPRTFARDYFKRFDFLKKLAELVAQGDPEKSYGLAGKEIWITEFGIPTKKLGKANAGLRGHPRLFIYDRATRVPDGIRAIIWEDKWVAFLDQVSPEYLRKNRAEAFLVYTLRETVDNETHDDNHSNFALYRADWSCRIEFEVLNGLADFFLSFRNGQAGKPTRGQTRISDPRSLCP